MRKHFLLLAGLLGLHLFLLVNLRFTAWPEMLSYPYLRNSGYLLYKDMVHPYPPLLTIILSQLYLTFGYKLVVLKIFTWVLILTTDLLIFFTVGTLAKNFKYSVLGLAFYVFLQPFLEGNMLWFDLVIVLPILFALLLLLMYFHSRQNRSLNNGQEKYLIAAGFSLAIAALIKQTAGIFLAFSFFYLAFRKVSWKSAIALIVGPFALGAPLFIRLIQERALFDFFNWTLIYPLTKWGSFPDYVQMSLTKRETVILALLFTPLFSGFLKFRKSIAKDYRWHLLVIFLAGAAISIYPRFSLFHFQLMLVLISVIAGFLVNKNKNFLFLFTAFYVLLIPIVHKPVLAREWRRETRFYGKEDLKLTDLITKETDKDEKVLLLGLHSGLYTLSDRLPPKPWVDNFGWYLEIPGVQEEILGRWQENFPQVVLWKEPESGNWFDLGTYQPQKITKWIQENYNREEGIMKGVWLWQKRS